jgi:hypothetical protein
VRGLLVPLGLWLGFGQGFVDDADRDLDPGGDGADGFSALAAGQDRGAFVVVDHGSAAAVQAVLDLADDVGAVVIWPRNPAKESSSAIMGLRNLRTAGGGILPWRIMKALSRS